VSVVEKARGTTGCLDFAITADLIDPGRVNIFERWESQAAVKAFRKSPPQQARRGNALGVGSGVRHRRRTALVRGRHSMNLQWTW
jgi:quinol monooxygenase YgiN